MSILFRIALLTTKGLPLYYKDTLDVLQRHARYTTKTCPFYYKEASVVVHREHPSWGDKSCRLAFYKA